MSGIKRYDSNDSCEEVSDGDYVKFADHAAEIARLRAELEKAAAAALANMSLACQKEREADALRVDAIRYRWLRDRGREHGFAVEQDKGAWVHTHAALSLDGAIDGAMGANV